jgi:hypothetical protein
LREVALTFTAPKSWAHNRILRTDRLSITAAGRNLGTWTKFTGIDPEMSVFAAVTGLSQSDEIQDPFQAIPPPTYYTLRVNFGF